MSHATKSQVALVVSSPNNDLVKYSAVNKGIHVTMNTLQNLLSGIIGGALNCEVDILAQDGAQVPASNTLTLVSVVATNACTVAGVTFTAVASNPTSVQFLVGASDTATALNLAAAINANATTKGIVDADTAAGVVSVFSLTPGLTGNFIPLAGGTNITIGSGSTLLGGTGGYSRFALGFSQ